MTTSATTTPKTTTNTDTGIAGPTILTRAFVLDRLTAFVSAAALTLGAAPIARLLDWPTWIVLAVGVVLIPYGWMLHTIVRDQAHHSSSAKLSAAGDVLWVVASVATMVLAADVTSTLGRWIIAAQALMVADIGLLKMVGWRRS